MDNRPIGVFDSGVGGLTVVREIQKQMPNESVIYLGDTARVPYGGRDPQTILSFGRELTKHLREKDVKAIIIACGTVSSNGFETIMSENLGFPIFDVITPGVRACVDAPFHRVGFIATQATVQSGLYARLLKARKPGVTVLTRACPLFVPMAEEGWVNNVVTQLVAETYLDDMRGQIDALVLGCTHYPLLSEVIGNVMPEVKIINMAEYTVLEAKEFLVESGMTNGSGAKPEYHLFATGHAENFELMAKNVLVDEYTIEKAKLSYSGGK